jgi:hypothetical protein
MIKKNACIGLAFALIVVFGAMGFARAFYPPQMDLDDQVSQPNGYAEAVVMGSWNTWGNPYYSVRHTGMAHPSNLWGTVTFKGWNKTGTLIYSITLSFSGTVTYDPPYHNVIWTAETTTVVSGETADAWIGPPGVR